MNAPEKPLQPVPQTRARVTIDRAARRALVDGHVCDLSPRLFDALLWFAEHPGELLTKTQLLDTLWAGSVVEENNLSQLVTALRRALGDDARSGRFIQTVPRRGFRWIADVQYVAADGDVAAPVPAMPATPAQPPALHDAGRWRYIAGLTASVVMLFVLAWSWTRPPAESGPVVLAVAPFKPLLPDAADPVLEAGMAESLRSRLSSVPRITLVAAASAGDPSAGNAPVNAEWWVDGTIHRWNDRVRVYAQLRRSNGLVAWSGSFDERYTHAFEVHDAVAQRVVAALADRLAAATREAGATKDPQAFEAYAVARLYLDTTRNDRLPETVQLLQKAIARDPNYALAHSALAVAYSRMPLNLDTPPVEAFEPAKKAAERARTLAPALAEPHVADGFIHWWYERDPAAAERSFRRALELEPQNAFAIFALGHWLANQGRFDEGFAMVRRARELSPHTALFHTVEAGYLAAGGNRPAAEERLQVALDMTPPLWIAYLTQGQMRARSGDLKGAIESFERAHDLSHGLAATVAQRARLRARTEGAEPLRQALAELQARAQEPYVPPTILASLHTELGDHDTAVMLLGRAIDARDPQLAPLKSDSRWTALRQHPGFIELARKLSVDVVGPQTKSAH